MPSNLRPVAPNFANGRRRDFDAGGFQHGAGQVGRMDRTAFRSAGAALDDPRWAVLDLIEPAPWTVSKTEGIVPNSNFWWLDDAPTEHDRDWLRAHSLEDRLVEVTTDEDDVALITARSFLEWS